MSSTDGAAAAEPLQGVTPLREVINKENCHDNIANDIDGNIYAGVEGFYAKFFEAKPWSSAAERMVEATRAQAIDKHIGQSLQSLEAFAAWLSQFQSNLA
ncbi:hypothetical protein QQX98_013096 [Neonectria punicea]|uniref:Uncharacterized protein n=1 Tax=Neonectria punicea TaxID=979145 RepID=A0ABR1GH32_9HYPO